MKLKMKKRRKGQLKRGSPIKEDATCIYLSLHIKWNFTRNCCDSCRLNVLRINRMADVSRLLRGLPGPGGGGYSNVDAGIKLLVS